MRPFNYQHAANRDDAVRLASQHAGSVQFLAGGTTLVDLMKLDVMRPTTVVDLTGAAPVLVRRGRGDPALLGLGEEEAA